MSASARSRHVKHGPPLHSRGACCTLFARRTQDGGPPGAPVQSLSCEIPCDSFLPHIHRSQLLKREEDDTVSIPSPRTSCIDVARQLRRASAPCFQHNALNCCPKLDVAPSTAGARTPLVPFTACCTIPVPMRRCRASSATSSK